MTTDDARGEPATDRLGPALQGRLTADGDAAVYEIIGELDLGGAAALAARLEEVVAATGGDLVLDLARMPFVDSTGLRILIDARRHLDARGRRLVLRAMQPDVERLLRLTAMEAWFEPRAEG